jgi:5'-nucleotidase
VTACAEQVFIGHRTCKVDSDCGNGAPAGSCTAGGQCKCSSDADCGNPVIPGICDLGVPGVTQVPLCSSPIATENLYELATSDYLAGGGSGYRVLQRNTTQFNTLIQQRDAATDYFRQATACGTKDQYGHPIDLLPCSSDADCASRGDFVCACPSKSHGQDDGAGGVACTTDSDGCAGASGLCVRNDCRSQVAAFHQKACADSPYRDGCLNDLNACSLAGEECKFLPCVDEWIGNSTDNRVEMIGR